MRQLISISQNGAIRILDIPLGASVIYTRNTLYRYGIRENNNCISIDGVSFDGLPKLNIHFSTNEDNRIYKIYIGNSQLTKNECEKVYHYFYKHLKELAIVSKSQTEQVEDSVLTNSLHKVTIGVQHGLGNEKEKHPFFLHIEGLIGLNDAQLKNAVCKLYTDEHFTIQKKHHTGRNIFSKTIKVLLCIFALIIAYLYALNGRYIGDTANTIIFDTWTQEWHTFTGPLGEIKD